ncbi:MAG: SPASM domain-containing protein [Flavobacteriales bacterium]
MTRPALHDALRLTGKLTFYKVWNVVVVFFSFHLSRITKSNVHSGLPVSISIEPTTACNLGCPECPSGLKMFSRDTGNIAQENFRKWIDDMARHVAYINFYFQGEPFIHPKFLEMVRYASQKRIYTSTSTNAHFLHDELAKQTVQSGLDRLIISIDGTTQEVYEQYRIHGKLDKVIDGTRNVLKWKKVLKSKTPFVIFQFLVVRPNEHQTDDVLRLADELGVDEVRFKTAQVYNHEHGNPLIPTTDKYSRYTKRSDGTYAIKNSLDNHCWRMWSGCVVTWDGLVVPCCFDKDATHRLGDLKQNTMQEIWNNAAYKSFRSQLFRSRSEIDICANCSEGTKVWAGQG